MTMALEIKTSDMNRHSGIQVWKSSIYREQLAWLREYLTRQETSQRRFLGCNLMQTTMGINAMRRLNNKRRKSMRSK